VRRWEDRMIRRGFPLFRGLINRVLEIRPGIEREDEAVIWEELDFVAGLLADGRPHLCGDRFGAADVTFAAMAAPLVVPPVYGTALPQPDVLPADTAALVERAREHPAGRYALGLYADYRRQPPDA
jgi:glutathione S-transferase